MSFSRHPGSLRAHSGGKPEAERGAAALRAEAYDLCTRGDFGLRPGGHYDPQRGKLQHARSAANSGPVQLTGPAGDPKLVKVPR